MDFITQNVLGAVAGQAAMARRLGWKAAALGAAGGAIPDFDFLLTRFADPAFPHEFHRHFTHSIVFIPFGAVIATLPFLLIPSVRREWKLALLTAFIGCATHAVLDCCTSYGTMWYWPFRHERVSWDLISIIDLAFTLPLMLGVFLAWRKRGNAPAIWALVWATFYMGCGYLQRERALDAQQTLATLRGHHIERGRTFPTMGNLFFWRSVYQYEGTLWADAIALNGPMQIDADRGSSIPLLLREDLAQRVHESDRVMEVFDKLHAFADGYVAALPFDESLGRGRFFVGDMRYSRRTYAFQPLWGLTINLDDPITPVQWTGWRSSTAQAIDREQ